jgi:antibiotic biosynthesis monooxygenase (ABM) superfamily enzyme
VIQIVYRHEVAPGTEAAFVEAWERCKERMLGRAKGFKEASIFRNATDPTRFVCISRWESLEDWQRYWGEGVPDPEGELPKNEILVEVKTLTGPPPKKATRRVASPRPS